MVQKDNNVTSQNPDFQERLRQWLGTNTSSHRLPLSEFSKSRTVGNVSSKYRLNSFRWGPQTSVSDSGPPFKAREWVPKALFLWWRGTKGRERVQSGRKLGQELLATISRFAQLAQPPMHDDVDFPSLSSSYF